MTKHVRALSPEERTLAVERLCALVDQTTSLLWDTVAGFVATGSPVDDMARALGISRATLYRRLELHQGQREPDV